MRGEVVRPDVGLDLDDPADPSLAVGAANRIDGVVGGGRVGVADEERAEQPSGGVDRWTCQELPVEDPCAVQDGRNVSTTSGGNRKPKTDSSGGMIVVRKSSAVTVSSSSS